MPRERDTDAAAAALPRRAAHLDELSDDLVLRLLSRAPFTTHGTLHVVSRRLRTLLRSPAFRRHRVESRLAEYGLVVAGGHRGDITAECWRLSSGRWRQIAPLSGPRRDACSAIVENEEDGQPEMWVMGGWDGLNRLATVEAYNPRTNRWRWCLPLKQRGYGAVAGVVGGHLVVAGGFDRGALTLRLTSVEAFTPTGWISLPPLPHAADRATACELNGQLYVMGGVLCNKLQVLEVSEGAEFSWSVKADLPAARYHGASVVYEGKLWLIGGLLPDGNATASVIIYDTASDSWARGPTLPDAAIAEPGVRASYLPRLRAMLVNGEIYLICCNRWRCLYVFRNNNWEELAGGPRITAPACEFVLLG